MSKQQKSELLTGADGAHRRGALRLVRSGQDIRATGQHDTHVEAAGKRKGPDPPREASPPPKRQNSADASLALFSSEFLRAQG